MSMYPSWLRQVDQKYVRLLQLFVGIVYVHVYMYVLTQS